MKLVLSDKPTNTLLLKVNVFDEYSDGPKFAVVVIDEELKKQITSLNIEFMDIKGNINPNICTMTLYDNTPIYIPSELEEELLGTLTELLGYDSEHDQCFLEPIDESELIDFVDSKDTDLRIEASALVIAEDTFFWDCYLKNTNVKVETVSISIDKL